MFINLSPFALMLLLSAGFCSAAVAIHSLESQIMQVYFLTLENIASVLNALIDYGGISHTYFLHA